MTPALRHALLAALVAAAAFGVYAPALDNGFVWDDEIVVQRQLPRYDGLLSPFLPARDVPQGSPFYFRPVVILSYLLDRALGGGAPWAFHLSPLLFHALASLLLFELLRRLLPRPGGPGAELPATLAALLFALHPVHSEVVAWMTGRAESLALLGVLAALLAWLRWLEGRGGAWLLAGGLGLLFGLLSKETALAGAPLATALPLLLPAAATRRHFLGIGGAAACAVLIYLLLRAVALQGVAAGLPVERDLGEGVQGMLGALGFYGQGLLLGGRPGGVWTFLPSDARHLAAGALGGLAAAAGLLLALRARAHLALWGLAWIGVGLALPLFLLLRAISETPIADRYLYLPSVGLAVLVAWGLTRLRGPGRWIGIGLLLPVLAVAGLASARASRLWHDDLVFWRNAVAVAPDDGFPRLKLGVELYGRGSLEEAEATYHRALERRLRRAQRAVTQNNLAWLLLQTGRCDEAEPLFRASIASGPRISGPYRGLVECIWSRGREPAARPEIRKLLERALELDPQVLRSALLLGHLHRAEGELERAVHWYRYAARLGPGTPAGQEASRFLAGLGRR